MKELSRRYINLHQAYSPLQCVPLTGGQLVNPHPQYNQQQYMAAAAPAPSPHQSPYNHQQPHQQEPANGTAAAALAALVQQHHQQNGQAGLMPIQVDYTSLLVGQDTGHTFSHDKSYGVPTPDVPLYMLPSAAVPETPVSGASIAGGASQTQPELAIVDPHISLSSYQLQVSPGYQLLQYLPRSASLSPLSGCKDPTAAPATSTGSPAVIDAGTVGASLLTALGASAAPAFHPAGVKAAALSNMLTGSLAALTSPGVGRAKQAVISPTNNNNNTSKARSPLLENFRNNRCPNLTLTDISKHGLEFSKDQHGSRFIQQKLESSKPDDVEHFFKDLEPSVLELFSDVFGNYVIQKLLEHGNANVKDAIFKLVLANLKELTKHQYGCRVVQKVLFTLGKEQRLCVVKELEGYLVDCILDQHGNHVVQKCVETVGQPHLEIILSKCIGQICDVSCNPYGCRVIQRLLENCTVDQRNRILTEVYSNIEPMILDQFGNYVVQHVLDHGSVVEKLRVVEMVRGRIVSLSQHKYSSNVVEKCVERGREEDRRAFVQELLECGRIGEMIEGQYSNYVLQKIMDTAPINVLQDLMLLLRLHRPAMEKHSYGKNIKVRMEKFLGDRNL